MQRADDCVPRFPWPRTNVGCNHPLQIRLGSHLCPYSCANNPESFALDHGLRSETDYLQSSPVWPNGTRVSLDVADDDQIVLALTFHRCMDSGLL